jgi:hypothetical protein
MQRFLSFLGEILGERSIVMEKKHNFIPSSDPEFSVWVPDVNNCVIAKTTGSNPVWTAHSGASTAWAWTATRCMGCSMDGHPERPDASKTPRTGPGVQGYREGFSRLY